jgi:NAD(P)-dependent dehydrogenase (short-subunit alcohol dehydrogenase family)
VPRKGDVVLVTGASRGFGALLVVALLERGYRPFASMRDVGGRNRGTAEALRARGVDVVELDVTVEESINAGVADVLGRAGRVDVLVNNAGYGTWTPIELGTTSELRAQLETALVGPHLLVQALLPGMRERGHGLLVHVSSIAGRLAVPGFGLYCAAKWALEAMAEALRYELAPFGVDSVIVEPGPYATDFHGSSLQSIAADGIGPYELLRQAQEGRRQRGSPGNPTEVVEAILQLVELPTGERPARLPVGAGLTQELIALNREQARITRQLLDGFRYPDLLANGA